MNLHLTGRPKLEPAIHIELGDRTLTQRLGVVLTLTDPASVLLAARSAGRSPSTWVIWGLDALPMSEKRSAAFALAVGRAVRGPVYVVLSPGRGRVDRIIGHLLRGGCEQS